MFQTTLDNLRLVVFALRQRLTSDIIEADLLWGFIIIGVSTTRWEMDPTLSHAIHDDLMGNIQSQGDINREGAVQLLGLLQGTREAIQKNGGSGGLVYFVPDQIDDQIVRNQFTFIHKLLGGLAKLSPFVDILAKQVTTGNLQSLIENKYIYV